MENIQQKGNYTMALVTLTTLFFMWGFITCLNDLVSPYMKEMFQLSHFQANLVQFAFFAAYFVISLIYFLISSLKGDPIQKIGYKNTIVAGLLISAVACFLFFFEAKSAHPQFHLFLMALFLLGTGFTFLQIAANPLVSILGTPETSSSRLNLSQAFNSLGTTLAPVIGGYFIFKFFVDKNASDAAANAHALQVPYLFLASVLLVLAGVIFFSDVPSHVGQQSESTVRGMGALRHPYLIFGMLGIFCYVGAEVAIGNNLISYMKEFHDLDKTLATSYLSFYWGGSMIGRFMGSISMSKMPKAKKYLLMALAGIATVSLIFYITNQTDAHIQFTQVFYFLLFLGLNYLVFIVAKSVPSRTLGLFAVVNICLILGMLNSSGSVSLWMILAVGLFNSIMFSNVFTLAIDGLDEYTAQGSSLLVMMILGGALVPLLHGFIADKLGSKVAFVVPMVCYAYLLWYGFFGSHIGKKKTVEVKKVEHPESMVLDDASQTEQE